MPTDSTVWRRRELRELAISVSSGLTPVPDWVSGAVDRWISATVPSDIFTDLECAGPIDDPLVEDNELKVQWVGRTDWEYFRAVTIDDALLDHDAVRLECLGMDMV